MKTYTEYQNTASSEKVTLCTLEGTKRLQGFQLDSGSFFKIDRNGAVILSLSLNGEDLESVNSIEDLSSNSYYFDDSNIYISSAVNPNSKHLYYVLKQKFFFSDKGVSFANDFDSGFEVYFEPGIKGTTTFGVELDTVNEGLSAIEGEGSITFFTNEFWTKNFDKINFDNQFVRVYSWNSRLQASDAKLIFAGLIEGKSFGSDIVSFKVKDLLYKLRTSFNLNDISDLDARNSPSLDSAKQRIVYGSVKGFLPVNIDSLLNGSYPIKGTVSLFNNSPQVVGTNTKFKEQLVPGDKLRVSGRDYTVQAVISDVNLTLTANFVGVNVGSAQAEVVPTIDKTYYNRQWLISGHELNEPETQIRAGSTTQILFVDSTQDFFSDDVLCIDTGAETELVKVREILNENLISLSQTTNIAYPDGTRIFRPCVQNVKMDDISLVYKEDYDIDPTSGILILSEDAEINRAPLLEAKDRVTVETGDTSFVGTSTKFTNYLKPGYFVRPQTTENWYKILSLTDTEITLSEEYTGLSFTSAESLPEKTSISGLSDYVAKWNFYSFASADELQGTYFKLWDSAGSVAVWFDIGNVGTPEPDHECNRAIEITTVHPGNNHVTVMQKVMQKLNLDSEFKAEMILGELVISSSTIGVRPTAKPSVNNDFELFNRANNEQVLTLTADVADSLDETGFYLYDSVGAVFFWYATDNNLGAVEPSNTGYRVVKITTVNTDDNVSTVRSKTKTAVDSNGFSSSNLSSDKLLVTGSMAAASSGTMPSTTVTTLSYGKSAYNLNSKYFIIPYYNGTACFWINVDGLGVNPGISATTTNVIALTSDLEESDIFAEIGETIDSHANLEVEISENSLLITDIAEQTLSHMLSVGTSGLTIVQAQAGVSSNPEAGAILQYKNYIFGDNSKLYLDVYGKSDSTGKLIQTAPEIVKDILVQAGMNSFVDYESFNEAGEYFSEQLAFCIPENYSDKATSLTFRDVINKVNTSVLGTLLQDDNFNLQYRQIKPSSRDINYFSESDIIDFSFETTNKNIIKRAICEYGFKEYSSSTNDSIVSSVFRDSLNAEYLSNVSGSRTFETYLLNESDAQRLANRWGFLLEQSSGVITFTTKLAAIHLEVGSVIQISHRKFFERFGGQSKLKLVMVEAVRKTSKGVEVVCIDLSNAFNRVAKITDSSLSFVDANDETRLLSGYYCDANGSIDDIPESFNINLIW